MLHIYVPSVSNRLVYIFDYLLTYQSGISYKFITNEEEVKTENALTLSYGPQQINSKTPHLYSANLLFEDTIRKQTFDNIIHQNINAIYKVKEGGLLPFDPFAASFYIMSRYEEYLPNMKDRYGRYRAEDSIASKADFLDKPVVDIWANEIRNLLIKLYPTLEFKLKQTYTIPTINFNHIYEYKHQGFIETCRLILSNLLQFKISKLSKHFLVITGIMKDPYDNYTYLEEVHHKFSLQPIFFFITSGKDGSEQGISYKNKKFIALLQRLNQYAKVGLQTLDITDRKVYKKFIFKQKRLESILDQKINKSRSYRGKYSIPQYYTTLLKVGIQKDYSMGYSGKIGFRAGTSNPFTFFNLENNENTSLTIYPVCFTDNTLKKHLGLKPRDIIPYLLQTFHIIKENHGTLTFSFNNEIFSDPKLGNEWKNTYAEILKQSS